MKKIMFNDRYGLTQRDLLEERICFLNEIIAWMPIPKFETKDK